MMKKILIFALGVVACAALAPAAQAQTFESGLQSIDLLQNLPYIRYYTNSSISQNVNPSGRYGSCPTWEGTTSDTSTENYCGAIHKTQKRTYRAYSELLQNYGPAPQGTVMHAVWDYQQGTGADRTGYYAWAADPVVEGDTMDVFNINCTGTALSRCLGAINPDSAVGTDIANAPGTSAGGDATIAPISGLRPIPVPRVTTASGAFDPINLDWDAASLIGSASFSAQYDIYFAKDSTADATCSAREGTFTFLKTVTGLNTTVALSEIGEAAGNPTCVSFAIRLRYPPAGGVNAFLSRYLSRAGQAVILDGGVTAAEVYDLLARRVGASSIEVSWKTSLEDGVRGFYVTRSFTENGTFERVSTLIPAKGEPSAYSFVDQANAQALRVPGRVAGLFYRVEAVDIDDNVTPFGPVKAELGAANQVRPGQRIQRQTR